MQAVILVGGEGTRLRPLTYGTPKPMVPLFGVPMLERTLSRLKFAGIDHAILAAGYLPRAITDHLGDGSRLGMRIDYVIEESPLGTAGALKNVAHLIEGAFFVLNGDILTSLDLAEMLAFHRAHGGIGVLHLIRADDPSAFGCVVHDATGRISRFVEKPPRGEEPTNEVNAGTYLLEAAVLDAIPAGRSVSIERETFPLLLARNAPLYAFTTADYWLDIGRPEQYLQAHLDTLAGKMKLGKLADGDLEPGRFFLDAAGAPPGVAAPAFIGNGVTLGPGATVGPNAVLGDRVTVGPGARVTGSILWDGVTVGEGAAAEGAILASNVRVGAGATIYGGAVIGHDVEIEPGATVPADARIGVVQPA